MNRENSHGSESTPRTGPLRNGNARGDPNSAPRCGAHNRAGCACRAPAMANGRCRVHGGKSTGPTTAEGMAKVRAARSVHGFYGEDGRAFLRLVKALGEQGRQLRDLVSDSKQE
jgi:hypothetical protein